MVRSKKDMRYEVERLIKAMVSHKRGRKINWKYLVKWKGYGDKDNTWEPPDSFDEASVVSNFWKQVDTGGRSFMSARLFKVGEELSPRGSEPGGASESDAEGKENEDEAEKGHIPVKRPRGSRKRSLPGTEDTRKGKRGRKSKGEAETKKADESSGDEDAEKSDVSRRRSLRRVSENSYGTRARKSVKGKEREKPQQSSSDDESPEGVELLDPSEKRTASRKSTTISSPRKKRKAYIEESEEEENGAMEVARIDAEGTSSRGGSLFSGDEGEEELKNAQETTATDVVGSTEAIPGPSTAPEHPSDSRPPRKLPYHRARAAKPRVKMVNDPNISKALATRVRVRRQEEGTNKNDTVAAASASLKKPTLLTFENGKLTSQRREVSVSEQTPSTPVASGSNVDIAVQETERNVDGRDSEAMDTSPDFVVPAGLIDGVGGSADSEATFEELISFPVSVPSLAPATPPTADELLRLAGTSTSDGQDFLPDFDPFEEDAGSTSLTGASATAESTAAPALFSFGQASGPLATPGPGSWRHSTIFSLTSTRITALRKALTSAVTETPPQHPTNTFVPLRLSPSSTVPVTFKDVSPATYDPSQKLTSLLVGEHSGAPGKVFQIAVLEHVKTGGSSARLAVDESATDEQRAWFSKLVDELEKGGLFIVAVDGHSLVLCSSQNREAGDRLSLPSALVGLARNVAAQHVAITDDTSYANFALEAEDLKLH